MNERSRIGATNVLSKLRNAIHLVKKGALSGNAQAKQDLARVMEKIRSCNNQVIMGEGNSLTKCNRLCKELHAHPSVRAKNPSQKRH